MLWLLLSTAIFVIFISELMRRRKVFSLRSELGLDGPPTSLIWGNLDYFLNVVKTKGIEASKYSYIELAKQYGKVFGLYIGGHLEVVVSDPDIIKEVFVSQFSNFIDRKRVNIFEVYPVQDGLLQVTHKGTLGAGWKEIRSVISAIFTSGKMKRMHRLFPDQLENFIEELRAKSKLNNGGMDVYAEYQALTMDMISRVALGQNICCVKERDNEFYGYARRFIANISFAKSTVAKLALFMPVFRHLRPYSMFGRAEMHIVKQLSVIIRDREEQRAKGNVRPEPDLIDLILAENEKRADNGDRPLHHDVVVSNVWALFAAGYETTSTALAYSTWMLAKHPEAQQQLYEEVTETFGKSEEIDYERVMKMQYMHAVFSETLRILPPVVLFTGRTCIKDTVIGGKYRIPAGVCVHVPVHVVHASEELYDQPEKFMPERFLSDGSKQPSWTSSYLPFGIGPRNCVGARFAEMEFKTVLADVVRKFSIHLDPQQMELPTVITNILQVPKDNKLFARLVERE